MWPYVFNALAAGWRIGLEVEAEFSNTQEDREHSHIGPLLNSPVRTKLSYLFCTTMWPYVFNALAAGWRIGLEVEAEFSNTQEDREHSHIGPLLNSPVRTKLSYLFCATMWPYVFNALAAGWRIGLEVEAEFLNT